MTNACSASVVNATLTEPSPLQAAQNAAHQCPTDLVCHLAGHGTSGTFSGENPNQVNEYSLKLQKHIKIDCMSVAFNLMMSSHICRSKVAKMMLLEDRSKNPGAAG